MLQCNGQISMSDICGYQGLNIPFNEPARDLKEVGNLAIKTSTPYINRANPSMYDWYCYNPVLYCDLNGGANVTTPPSYSPPKPITPVATYVSPDIIVSNYDQGGNISYYEIWVNGVYMYNTSNATFRDENLPLGNYAYQVVAINNLGNKSPISEYSNTIQVTSMNLKINTLAYNGGNYIYGEQRRGYTDALEDGRGVNSGYLRVVFEKIMGGLKQVYSFSRSFMGYDTSNVFKCRYAAIELTVTDSGDSSSPQMTLCIVKTNPQYASTHVWVPGDFASGHYGTLVTNTVGIPNGFTGTVRFTFNQTGLDLINQNNMATFSVLEYDHDLIGNSPSLNHTGSSDFTINAVLLHNSP